MIIFKFHEKIHSFQSDAKLIRFNLLSFEVKFDAHLKFDIQPFFLRLSL